MVSLTQQLDRYCARRITKATCASWWHSFSFKREIRPELASLETITLYVRKENSFQWPGNFIPSTWRIDDSSLVVPMWLCRQYKSRKRVCNNSAIATCLRVALGVWIIVNYNLYLTLWLCTHTIWAGILAQEITLLAGHVHRAVPCTSYKFQTMRTKSMKRSSQAQDIRAETSCM